MDRNRSEQLAQVRQISPEETARLMEEGAVYVDVRSEPEFDAGHPPGSYNVPLLHMGPMGLVPNPEFMSVMQQAFGPAEKLIMGCRSGQRSLHAAELLLAAGYADVSNLLTGWEGTRDAFGRPVPGWRMKGLPIETGRPEGRKYDDAKRRTPK